VPWRARPLPSLQQVLASHRSSACPSVRPSVYPSVCLSVCPSVRPSVRPSIRPSVRPSVPPFIRPSGCPVIHPPVHVHSVYGGHATTRSDDTSGNSATKGNPSFHTTTAFPPGQPSDAINLQWQIRRRPCRKDSQDTSVILQ
jgi:hypothetical protein